MNRLKNVYLDSDVFVYAIFYKGEVAKKGENNFIRFWWTCRVSEEQIGVKVDIVQKGHSKQNTFMVLDGLATIGSLHAKIHQKQTYLENGHLLLLILMVLLTIIGQILYLS